LKLIYFLTIIFSISLYGLHAEETRQVDKHEHGVGELNIAIENKIINFEFMIPGADIVGFEYKAKSTHDIATVNSALKKFDDYKNIFIMSGDHQCILLSQKININQEDEHDEHGEHDEHDEETHNEFYVKYSFECDSINLINKVEFPYFVTFPNSGELEVQFISELGSTSFEVEADKPVINIEGKI
jgi:hypothetical protein